VPKWLFLLTRLQRRLWLTVALYSVAGVGTALVSATLARYVPADFPLKLGSEAVGDILTILASSMLAVATFSLTTLVTAYTSVVSNVTPHAAKLLVSDGAIRSSLGTFIGAFIFSVVGIIALHTGYYGAQGRVILFFNLDRSRPRRLGDAPLDRRAVESGPDRRRDRPGCGFDRQGLADPHRRRRLARAALPSAGGGGGRHHP
jgi:hypothetical protein